MPRAYDRLSRLQDGSSEGFFTASPVFVRFGDYTGLGGVVSPETMGIDRIATANCMAQTKKNTSMRIKPRQTLNPSLPVPGCQDWSDKLISGTSDGLRCHYLHYHS